MRSVIQEVVVDCADPAALSEFWGALLGVRRAVRDPAWAVVDATPVLLAFQAVPEPKSYPKNRLHLDVEVDDARTAVERAVALGARELRSELDASGDGYVVLVDPEENEFCFVVDTGGEWVGAARAALDAAPAPA